MSEAGHERERTAGEGENSPAFGDWGATPRIPSTGTNETRHPSTCAGGLGNIEKETANGV